MAEQPSLPSSKRRPIVIGNWKMNGDLAAAAEVTAMAADLGKEGAGSGLPEAMICPPALYIAPYAQALREAGLSLPLGAQNCHPKATGAHTGEISAEMLAELGAQGVILGHSERRQDQGESDALVQEKVKAAWRAGLTAILCIGETEAQNAAGQTQAVLEAQVKGSLPPDATGTNTILAYEPIWAIGTGRTPTLDDIGQIHNGLRALLEAHIGAEAKALRLLYGGSVKPANAAEIFSLPEVDGGLVGGASLTAKDFLAICAAAQA